MVESTMEYTIVYEFYEGLAPALVGGDHWTLEGGKWGFIDKTGKVVIALIYDDVSYFTEGLAPVSKDGKWGYIDITGNVVIPLIYDYAWTFSEGLAAVKKDGKYGFINKIGEVVIPFLYSTAFNFSEGLAIVTNYDDEENWHRYIDKTGAMVIPLNDMIGKDFSEEIASVCGDGPPLRYGFMDTSGKIVVPLQYDYAGKFCEGLASVEIDEKWGFIDKTGKVVIPFEYQWAWDYSEGLAVVEGQEGRKYIDKTGKDAFPYTFGLTFPFSNGFAQVMSEDGVWNLIDKTGRLLLPLENEYTRMWYADGLVVVEENGKWGILEIVSDPLSTASTWAREGITSAIAKRFVPEDIQNNYTNVITRAEFCRMAVKWVEYITGKNIDVVLAEKGLSRDLNAFTDTSDPDILAAFALDITNGTGNNQFTPNGQFNREQAATMIMNTCRAIGADVRNPATADFVDLGTAAQWARTGINFVRANGIMQGVGNDRFDPKGKYTREQSIIAFNRIEFD